MKSPVLRSGSSKFSSISFSSHVALSAISFKEKYCARGECLPRKQGPFFRGPDRLPPRQGTGAHNPTANLSPWPPTFEQSESAWRHHSLSYWLEVLASSCSRALSRFLSWSISLSRSFMVTFSSVHNRFSNCVILRSFSATISF